MPPKRKTTASTSDSDSEDKTKTKKQKTTKDEIINSGSDSDSDNDKKKKKDICWYGKSCYRTKEQHPLHFKEFSHLKPKKPSTGSITPVIETELVTAKKEKKKDKIIDSDDEDSSKKKDKKDDIKDDKKLKKELENYKIVLRSALSGTKISRDQKRLLRQFRRDNHISDEEQNKLLMQFGWTVDEYEDGEKMPEDVELDEEAKVLSSSTHGIIILNPEKKKLDKQEELVFAKASAKFYTTMSKAGSNFTVKEVGVIVNSTLNQRIKIKKEELAGKGCDTVEEYGFHGTSKEAIQKIAEEGFKHPDELKLFGKSGKGVYITFYSDYSMNYTKSDQVLLVKLLRGKCQDSTGKLDGVTCKSGYDSIYSGSQNEIKIFDTTQILPRYIITYVAKAAKDRPQEF